MDRTIYLLGLTGGYLIMSLCILLVAVFWIPFLLSIKLIGSNIMLLIIVYVFEKAAINIQEKAKRENDENNLGV